MNIKQDNKDVTDKDWKTERYLNKSLHSRN